MILATLFIKQFGGIDEYPAEIQTAVSSQNSKTTFPEKYVRNKHKILLLTSFFGSMKWYENGQRDFTNVCKSGCILTDDKREIKQPTP